MLSGNNDVKGGYLSKSPCEWRTATDDDEHYVYAIALFEPQG
jgi:hypothetical protein